MASGAGKGLRKAIKRICTATAASTWIFAGRREADAWQRAKPALRRHFEAWGLVLPVSWSLGE
jgi:hypothetical protein